MRWFIALLLVGFSSFYLYTRFNRKVLNPPSPPGMPAAIQNEPLPFLSRQDLQRIRRSTGDPDGGVRWSAMELLFTFRDPDSLKLLEKAIAEDPDPALRLKAVRLLRDADKYQRVPGLVRGIRDSDTAVRIESLKALGEVGDPAATPWVTEALKDPEPEVKMEALRTLGQFEEKRKIEFHELAEKLRKQYEDAVMKAQKNAE